MSALNFVTLILLMNQSPCGRYRATADRLLMAEENQADDREVMEAFAAYAKESMRRAASRGR